MKTLRTGAALAAVAAMALTACASNEPSGGTASSAASSAASSDAGSALSGTLQGTGASSMKSAQEVWRAEFQKANPGVTVNYSPDGSGAGRTAFADGAAAFAGSDRALKDEEIDPTNEKALTFSNCAADTKPVNLPVYISPIAITYNVEGVDELHLDAEVAAKIFTGQITNWNDPAIAALNSGVTFPDLAITTVHRSDNSGTTENFTATLAEVAPEIWTEKPSGDWPAAYPGEGGAQTSGVISAIQNGTGTIGYADVSGLADGMKTALYNKDGSGEYVGPEAEAAAMIVEASKRVEGREANDWALELDLTAAGYPFVLVAYAIACQEYKDPAMGELVSAYISYMASDEGQKAAQPQAGNAPLTGEIAKGVQTVAAGIK